MIDQFLFLKSLCSRPRIEHLLLTQYELGNMNFGSSLDISHKSEFGTLELSILFFNSCSLFLFIPKIFSHYINSILY